MKMLVLGAGLQGSACAFDLLNNPRVDLVTLADLHPDRLPAFLAGRSDARLNTVAVNVKDHGAVSSLMESHDAVMSALPYYFNGPMAELASGATLRSSSNSRSSTARRVRTTYRSFLTAGLRRE